MRILFVALTATVFFSACQSKTKSEKASTDAYEKGAKSLEEIEQEHPTRFLLVTGKDRRNLIGQTVVKGSIHSKAKMVTYKDVTVKLSFYSSTGALLEEDQETIYESIAPGGEASFKSKYFAPKGTDSVGMKIL
ncbi:MAG TPA: hypothetical protein PKK69_03565, partial [Ferruginibacter sp.]|nr:hypothetical protein [Ferruginibacter sp.]